MFEEGGEDGCELGVGGWGYSLDIVKTCLRRVVSEAVPVGMEIPGDGERGR